MRVAGQKRGFVESVSHHRVVLVGEGGGDFPLDQTCDSHGFRFTRTYYSSYSVLSTHYSIYDGMMPFYI